MKILGFWHFRMQWGFTPMKSEEIYTMRCYILISSFHAVEFVHKVSEWNSIFWPRVLKNTVFLPGAKIHFLGLVRKDIVRTIWHRTFIFSVTHTHLHMSCKPMGAGLCCATWLGPPIIASEAKRSVLAREPPVTVWEKETTAYLENEAF